MLSRPLRRAAVLALAGLLALSGVASADIGRADGDALRAGVQTIVDLGEVAPSAEVSASVAFELVCSTANHVDPGQTVSLTWAAQAVPAGGAVVSATTGTLGPVPADWPADAVACPVPGPVLSGIGSTVTLRAPSAPGVGYMYTIGWSRSLSPAGSADGTALSGTMTSMAFRLTVVANTPPVVSTAGDRTVEGDTTGGWTATYPDVTATDVQDDPDPVATCVPAAGTVLPLGTTTVTCSATDAGGRTDSEAFAVTVVDTTAPVTAGVPADQSVTTDDPAGSPLAYTAPTATDVVDPAPTVGCSPAAGSLAPVGVTSVTCTASDVTGNAATASFAVTVALAEPEADPEPEVDPEPEPEAPTATVRFGWPIGTATTFVAKRGRTIPVKAWIVVDGRAWRTGPVALRVDRCDGGPSRQQPMRLRHRTWRTNLDTSKLVGACHHVVVVLDGRDVGGFDLELRGQPSNGKKGGH